jgi:hypothetical protein
MSKPYPIVEAPDGRFCEVAVNDDGTFSPRSWRPRRALFRGFNAEPPLPVALQRAVFSTGEAAMRAAYALPRK